jgi:prolyl-tRNA editing enzyme YbaK/EbsC (Cys-tRNA(Pro) deacylase)
MNEEITAYSQQLTDLGVENEIVEHPDLKAVPEVAAYLGITVADTLPTMIMKAGDEFVVIIRRGDTRLDFKKVKQTISKNIHMATPEEFTELTKLPLGTARVYNPGLKTYVDKNVFEKDHLVGGSGSFTCSIRYKTEDLKKLPDVQIVDVSQ